jgi:hypothetical protein
LRFSIADQRLLPQDHGVVEQGCVSSDNSTYTDCTKMITIVVGSPGCKEDLSDDHAPQGIAVFEKAYGYGHLTVRHNCVPVLCPQSLNERCSSMSIIVHLFVQIEDSVNAQWMWEQIANRDLTTGRHLATGFIDNVKFIQHNHGPRADAL